MKKVVDSALEEALKALKETVEAQGRVMETIATSIGSCFEKGGKVFLCGNGGSAADCQHIAAEFINRFRLDRAPLPAVALTTDTSVLTSISNDYSFGQVFAKQIQALGKKGDILWALSTSGSSPNVIDALGVARRLGIVTVGFTGAGKSKMEQLCDMILKVASTDTPRIQEVHIFCAHVICDMVERRLFGE